MRAATHASYRWLQDELSALGGVSRSQIVVLVGSAEARRSVRFHLEGEGHSPIASPTKDADNVDEGTRGFLVQYGDTPLVIVDIPEFLGPIEAVEAATFLKGLNGANCITLALEAAWLAAPSSPSRRPSPDSRAHAAPRGASPGNPRCFQEPSRGSSPFGARAHVDSMALLTEFYGTPDWRCFLEVAVVGSPSNGRGLSAVAASALVARLGTADRGLGPLEAQSLNVLWLQTPAEANRFADSLIGGAFPFVLCEPLGSLSPLLTQYRVMRQRSEQRRAARPDGGINPTRCGAGVPQRSHGLHPNNLSTPHSVNSSPCGDLMGAFPSVTSSQNGSAPKVVTDSENGSAQRRLVQPPGGVARPWTVMVFGKTGAGKSHLGNLLLGHNAFDSGDSMASVTQMQSIRRAMSADGSVVVLDTIGFGDTKLPPEMLMKCLRDTALEASGGLDLLVFVVKKDRMTVSEQEILSYVTQLLFGPDCLPNLYMVITHAGRLCKESPEYRKAWLQEQAEASPIFAALLQCFGTSDVGSRTFFVENPDPKHAEDDDELQRLMRRRQHSLSELQALFSRHTAGPFRHGLFQKAEDLHKTHLEETRREFRKKVEAEVRADLERERRAFYEEKNKLLSEVEFQRLLLQREEKEMQIRFEEEWGRMRQQFEQGAKELARNDLEPLAQEIVERTEKKHSRCTVM